MIADQWLAEAPSSVDIETIYSRWQALSGRYDVNEWRLPLPLWAQRPYDDSGTTAWERLQDALADTTNTTPMNIYMHIPFCSTKCDFCDSYSFQLRSHRDVHVDGYVDRLIYEMDLWLSQASIPARPVPTVHLGGGTPGFLGEEAFTRLIDAVRARFNIDDHTEWAIETTVESLTPSMISTLHHLGFRRLHIGAQSMEPMVRDVIGRRCTTDELLDAANATLARGWIVSVDLICGMPHQTFAGYVEGIEQLIDMGVDGFSLYELLIRPQNQRWAEAQGLIPRDHHRNYMMFQAGALLLEEHGFRKNMFNHWANDRDQNVYFTFPTRGEDLLAMGTFADGIFGDYHYRHPGYAHYLRTAVDAFPGLEGGLQKTPRERALQPPVTAILSAELSPHEIAEINALRPAGEIPLVDVWHDHQLVEDANDGAVMLTTSGSWFAGNMVSDILNHAAVTVPA